MKSSVGFDGADGKDTDSHDFEVNLQVLDLSWIRLLENVFELLSSPPVWSVVWGFTDEVSFVKVKVILRAGTAELWVLGIEVLKANFEGFLMPAADDEHALRASTVEHLSEAFFSNTIRQDTESVHAHAAESEGVLLPEFVVRLVSFFLNDVIEFQGITI